MLEDTDLVAHEQPARAARGDCPSPAALTSASAQERARSSCGHPAALNEACARGRRLTAEPRPPERRWPAEGFRAARRSHAKGEESAEAGHAKMTASWRESEVEDPTNLPSSHSSPSFVATSRAGPLQALALLSRWLTCPRRTWRPACSALPIVPDRPGALAPRERPLGALRHGVPLSRPHAAARSRPAEAARSASPGAADSHASGRGLGRRDLPRGRVVQRRCSSERSRLTLRPCFAAQARPALRPCPGAVMGVPLPRHPWEPPAAPRDAPPWVSFGRAFSSEEGGDGPAGPVAHVNSRAARRRRAIGAQDVGVHSGNRGSSRVDRTIVGSPSLPGVASHHGARGVFDLPPPPGAFG